MYKKQLEEDCRKIFGIKKVIFGDVDNGKEQGALYVSVESIRQNVNYGSQRFVVSLRLGLWGSRQGYPTGFFKNRLREAMKKKSLQNAAKRFLITGREESINFPDYEDYFVQTQVPALYKLTLEYDPAAKTKGYAQKVITYLKGLI